MAKTVKCCSQCGLPSWDSETGWYRQTHPLSQGNRTVDAPCDTNGRNWEEN